MNQDTQSGEAVKVELKDLDGSGQEPSPSAARSIETLIDDLTEAAIAGGVQVAGGTVVGETIADTVRRYHLARARLAMAFQVGAADRALESAQRLGEASEPAPALRALQAGERSQLGDLVKLRGPSHLGNEGDLIPCGEGDCGEIFDTDVGFYFRPAPEVIK